VLSGQSAPADGTQLTTGVTVAGDAVGQIALDATAIVDSTRALELSLDEDHDPVTPGALLHYTLTFGNRSTGLLPGAMLELPVPAGTTFQSASGGGTPTNGTVTWSLGDLGPGASGVRELVVQVDPTAGRLIAAEATLTSGSAEVRAQTATRVETGAALTASMTLEPDPVAPGEALLVALTVANRGATELFGVQATVRVPPEVAPFATNLTSGASGTVTCNSGGTFACDNLELTRWAVGDLPAGQGITLTIPAVVSSGQSAPPAGSVITWDADAIANDGTQAQARRSVAVRPNRALELDLDADPQPVGAGEALGYRLAFGNRGTGLLANAMLELPVPQGSTFRSATGGGTLMNGTVTWSLGDLAPGASGVRELVVDVDGAAVEGQPITAQALLTSGDAEARARLTTRVQKDVPLTLTVAAGPDPVSPGEPMAVSLTVTNRGPITLFGVRAALRVPPEVAPFAVNLTNGAVTCNAGGTFACDNLERALWTVGDLAAGRGVTLTVPVVVSSGQNAPPAGTVITFEADADANDGSEVYASHGVIVQPSRPLELELGASSVPVGAGGELRYTLTFGNRSTGLVQGATLALPIPAGTEFESVSDGGSVVAGQVTWSLGDLAPGASGVRNVVVQVSPQAVEGEPISAEAALTGSSAEARAQAVTRVENDLPLTVSVAVGPDPVAPGEALRALVTITNRGPISLFDVHAGLRVPPEVAAWAPASTNEGGTCNVGGTFACDNLEREIWALGEIKAGQGLTLTVPPVVLSGQSAPPAGAVITFEADATANDGSQALARHDVVVRPNRPLELELDATSNPVSAGDELHYRLTYGNRSAGTVTGASATLLVPQGTTFKSISAGGVVLDNVAGWVLGDLATGASGELELVVQVDAQAVEGAPIAAEATLTGTGAEARAQAVARVENDVPLALSVTVTPDPVTAGQTLLVTITVTNNGQAALFGVQAEARVPQEVTPFATTLTTGGATCNQGGTFACDNLERVLWTIGTPQSGLAGGQSVILTMSPTVPMGANAPPAGTVIVFEADASANDGSQVRAQPAVRVQ
jgi:uncharacterized repeat protein (TIGR01451 family)